MDYIDKLRSIVNEISDGSGNSTDNENDDNDNFMDSDSSPEQQSTPDDSSGGDDENDNFMDDGGTEDSGTSTDDSSDNESDNFMDDSESSSDESQTPDDSSGGDDESDNFMDDGGTEDSNGESSDEGSGEESDNFMDDSGGDGESSEGNSEENTDSSEEGSDDNSEESESNGEEENYDINKIEDELFSSLTPEQIAIKNHELKNQFIEMYSIIGSTLVRINDISKSNDNINILKFVTEKLLELREMIDYNITTAYSTRTYIENNIIYQQCIATLNAIAGIIENIPGVNGEIQKSQEEKEDKGEPVEKDSDSPQILNISDTGASDYQEESTDYNTLF